MQDLNPYESSKTQEPMAKQPRKRGFRLVELLIVVGVIGLLIAMLLPLRRESREAARRSSCSNNLKKIGIALHNYADEYGALPPAYTVDANGKPLHSWRTLILPFLEQKPLYESIDLAKPWDDPANQAAREAKVPAYACPSANLPAGQTTYLAIVGPNSCLQPSKPRKLDQITDSFGQTLIVLEVDESKAVHWMEPVDVSTDEAIAFAAGGKLSHQTGAQCLFADASVGFLSSETKPAALRAMISIAGGDDELAE